MSNQIHYYLSKEAKDLGISFSPPREMDAGFDLPSLHDFTIEPLSTALVRTGLHLAIPKGWVGIVKDRSSVALKGVTTLAGVIDASYRGEIKIVMHNLSDKVFQVSSGDRIAQCVIIPHLIPESVVESNSIEQLGETQRGHGGFGSTGL